MTIDELWRVYVEVHTPTLQDVEDLQLVIGGLETCTLGPVTLSAAEPADPDMI